MKILIDMQGAQTPLSAHSGVGVYTRELVKKLLQIKRNNDDIYLVLNGYFQQSCLDLINYFKSYIKREFIKVWNFYPLKNPYIGEKLNNFKDIIYFHEWFLNQLQPDVILTTNYQEGLLDGRCATSIGQEYGIDCMKIAVLHDITPLIIEESRPTDDVKEWYYKMIEYAKKSDYLITVSKYSQENISKYLNYKKDNIFVSYSGINKDKYFSSKVKKDRLITYIGSYAKYKNVNKLIDSFSLLPESIRNSFWLCLAGKDIENSKTKILSYVNKKKIKNIIIKGYLTEDEKIELLRKSFLYVMPSLGEGFGLPPVEAIACGTPAIASNNSSLPEVIGTNLALFDAKDEKSISKLITKIIGSERLYNSILEIEKKNIKKFHWDLIGKNVYDFIIDRFKTFKFKNANFPIKHVILSKNDLYLKQIAGSYIDSDLSKKKKVIYIDASDLVNLDYISGIQRVSYSLINEFKKLFENHHTYEFKVIYSDFNKNYFVFPKLEKNMYRRNDEIPDNIVQFYDEDTILFTGLHPTNVISKMPYLRSLMIRGINIYAVAFDLIPIEYPTFFDSNEFVNLFKKYLISISQFNGVMCISKTIQNQFNNWCLSNKIYKNSFFFSDYFHLGCDFNKSAFKSSYKKNESLNLIKYFNSSITFLVVSTIEPRKRHEQILSAFNILWERGYKINLVFAGRSGWNNDKFISYINHHKYLNKYFFWFNSSSDLYLKDLYSSSKCVIFASLSEGFGLSIVEAAKYNKPLILRDIPVFREVAKDNAFYFSGLEPENLSNAIIKWIDLFEKHIHPTSNGIKTLTWNESAKIFLNKIKIKI